MKNNHYKVGIVADDVTGSNDIGIMYAENGLNVNIFPHTVNYENKYDGDVAIIDTDSRFSSPEEAYERVYEATKKLTNLGTEYFFKKTCSVFRGNIGAEFDAMLDALKEDFAVVVLGFPDNGRTTVNSVHYVRGKLLEDSEFKNDPMNPMHESNLVGILKKQTKRRVGSICFDIIDKGAENLKKEISKLSEEYNYVILDVRNNEDLSVIAEAVKEIKIVCGASAIGKYLGRYITAYSDSKTETPPKVQGLGIFSISGSVTPQTFAQIEYARSHDTYVIEMDTVALINNNRQDLIVKISEQAEKNIKAGKNVLVYASNKREDIIKTKKAGLDQGLTEKQVSKIVSVSLSKISRLVIDSTRQNRVLIAGGDTSGSFCSEYDISGMSVYKEISPGLPSCISLSKPKMFMILKSGSFGNESFFIEAYEHLKKY